MRPSCVIMSPRGGIDDSRHIIFARRMPHGCRGSHHGSSDYRHGIWRGMVDRWRALAPLPSARGSANAVHVNGRIHVIGGATLPAGPKENRIHPSRIIAVGTHEVYDIASNSWATAKAMPTPRNHAAGGA